MTSICRLDLQTSSRCTESERAENLRTPDCEGTEMPGAQGIFFRRLSS